jgi:hypothetical protein
MDRRSKGRWRTVLWPCLVIVLAAATKFANVAFAQDSYHNCVNTGVLAWTCRALNQGSSGLETVHPIFTFGLFDVNQTGTITNSGEQTYDVHIEQGARFDVVRADLKPGESYHFGPYDKVWPLYSVVIHPYRQGGGPSAIGRVVLDQPSSSNKECQAQCTSRFEGCHQGCAQIEHSGAFCLAGCDAAQTYCLNNCPP